jgi:threonine dehydrogenase-like Zn-dependent dehydrogenase
VITHRFPLEKINEAMRIAEHEKDKALKILITFD